MPIVNEVELTTSQYPKPRPGTAPCVLHRQLAHDGSVALLKGYLMFIVKFQLGDVVLTS